MNESNHHSTNIGELRGRLLEVALRERLGAESPPDLSDRILAAAGGKQLPHPTMYLSEDPTMKKRTRYPVWLSVAVAATLLVGVTTSLFLSTDSRLWVAQFTQVGKSLDDNVDRRAGEDKSAVISSEMSSREEGKTLDDKVTLGYQWRRSFAEKGANPSSDRIRSIAATSTSDGDVDVRYTEDGTFPTPQADFDVLSTIADEVAPTMPAVRRSEAVQRLVEQPAQVPASSRTASDLSKVALSPEMAGGATSHGTAFGTDKFSNLGESEIISGYGRFGGREINESLNERQPDFLDAEGQGPENNGDKYTRIYENPFVEAVGDKAVSTFSIDVDTASYANVRQFLLQTGAMPPPDAVRIEELVNYFSYDYAGPDPDSEAPFAAHVEVSGCPWNPDHRLARIGIKGRELDPEKRPLSNLVFLIDVSGSMNQPHKLPLVVEGMKALTRELGENDRVAVVVYASSEGLVLPSTPGTEQKTILEALDQLQAGGSTAGGAGIQLAYQMAEDNFIEGGVNRVILCTDGDFNVGITSTAELERLVEQKAKDTGVFLSVLGFGRGNLNDAMMEAISGRGNGNYHYVDNGREARKVLVEEMTGTLVTIAKDVKIQIFFNPAKVAGYRLLGYENRLLAAEEFNDDTKDAGEIGAGHTVTALYEIVPADKPVNAPAVDESPYVEPAQLKPGAADSQHIMTLRMRYKQPDGDESSLLEWPITDDGQGFGEASTESKFAAAVAGFGMLLRDSEHKGNATWDAVLEIASDGVGEDPQGHRAEFLELVRAARTLRGE